MRTMLFAGFALLLIAASMEAQAQDEADPLAELAALGDAMAETGPEGGGSIRAKKDADMTALQRLKDPKNIEAKVEAVNVGRFPAVAIKVKVTRPATQGTGKSVARNAELMLLPKLKVADKKVQLEDPDTLINAGAFYLKKGDKVMLRLGAQKGKLWEAEYIERK